MGESASADFQALRQDFSPPKIFKQAGLTSAFWYVDK
jgi:hypothetical protein